MTCKRGGGTVADVADRVELPSIRRRSWLPDNLVLKVSSALGASALTALFAVVRLPDVGGAGWPLKVLAVVCGVVVAGGQVAVAWREWREARRWRPTGEPDDLAGWAAEFHGKLREIDDRIGRDDGSLRVTLLKVHYDRPDGPPVELEQIIRYVGGTGGELARRTSARCGIAGAAVRLRDPVSAALADHDEAGYRRELVRQFGFTRGEAEGLTSGRRSWLAVPLLYELRMVAGVVYLDAADADLLDVGDGDPLHDAIMTWCDQLAVTIRTSYRRT